MDDKYYSLKYTPAYGAILINVALSSVNRSVPITTIFTIFPLLYDDEFLQYICSKKIKSFPRIVMDYSNKNGKSNGFYVNYYIKMISMRRLCYESIYLGIISKLYNLNEDGLFINRIMFKEIPIGIEKIYAIKKLSNLACNLEIRELLNVLKVGE